MFASARPGAIRVQTSARPGNRARLLARGLAWLCELAALSSQSPLGLRHGRAVYALQKCNSVADLKAASQDLMPEGLATTDSIHQVLGCQQ